MCAVQGGTIVIGLETITFEDHSASYGPRKEELATRFVCSMGERALWGMALGYDKANYVNATGAMGLYGPLPEAWLRANYLDAPQAQAAREEVLARSREAQRRRAECDAKEASAVQALHEHPQVGMTAVEGVVIDVRDPLVLVQYNPRKRAATGRDQEWVPAVSLNHERAC